MYFSPSVLFFVNVYIHYIIIIIVVVAITTVTTTLSYRCCCLCHDFSLFDVPFGFCLGTVCLCQHNLVFRQ